MSQYFPEPYKHSGGNVKEANIKGARSFNKSRVASKTDLTGLKLA